MLVSPLIEIFLKNRCNSLGDYEMKTLEHCNAMQQKSEKYPILAPISKKQSPSLSLSTITSTKTGFSSAPFNK